MNRRIFDLEAQKVTDLGDPKFNDKLQSISSYKRIESGVPCLTLEVIEDKKEYFKRKLMGK